MWSYVDGNRFDSLEDAVEHIIKDIPCDRSKILRRYIGILLQELKTAKELIKGMNEYLSTKPEFWSREEKLEIVELSEKADQFVKQV